MAQAKKKTKKRAAAKKKTAAKNGAKKKPQARKLRSNENPHPRRLRGNLLLELRAASLEMELRRAKLDAVNAKIDALSMDPRYADVFLLLKQRESISEDMKDTVFSYAEVQKKIGKKFDIPIEDLHEYTFDTDTGVISLVGSDIEKET